MHPNIVNLDELESLEIEQGELRSRRTRIGPAAGAQLVGLSRWEIEPGSRSTPVHVHADEEEIFYVLDGSGLAVIDRTAYRVAAGDCLLHRANREAHSLVAGPEGLDVLAFAEGSRTNVTYLPREKVFWAGRRWVPADGPHPFLADVAKGPLELPEPESKRPPTILHRDEIEPDTEFPEGYTGRDFNFGNAAGSVTTGLRIYELDPGSLSCPPHWHTAEEELFVMLEGSGTAWLDDERHPLAKHDILWRPPATRVAHAIEAGEEGITFLGFGTRVPADVCFYPRSNKLNVGGTVFRVEPVDYWDGEV